MTDEDIEQKILKKVYVWLVAGGVVVGGVGGTGVLRIDKFTASDAELMRREISLEVEVFKAECQRQINEVEATKPPGLTRQRIRALEQSADRVDPNYDQPTWEWN